MVVGSQAVIFCSAGLPALAIVTVAPPINVAATCARTTRRALQARFDEARGLSPGAGVSTVDRVAVAAAKNVHEYDSFIRPCSVGGNAHDY
jgi:hypothetical protein